MLVAIQDIDEDTLLFRIPRSCILSVENSILSKEIPKATLENLGPWLSLILVMLYEYHNGQASNWYPYFGVLPTEFNTLMFWEEDELNELQASAVRNKIGKESADEMFKSELVPVIREFAEVFFSGDKNAKESAERIGGPEGLQLMHLMGTWIMAYAFDIEPIEANKAVDEEGYASEDEDEALPKGMVPMADMLNADADRNNARLFYEEDALCMKSIKPIRAGDEIFNDYGPLPRSDLLRRYGYITDNYTQYDVVELPFELVLEHVKQFTNQPLDQRLEYLDEQGVVETGYDVSATDPFDLVESISPELIVLTQALLLPDAEFDRLQRKGKLPKPENITSTDISCLLQVIKARAQQYATSLEEDFRQLVPPSGDLVSKERRYAMAKQVRIGEKNILRIAEAALESLSGQSNGVAKRLGEEGNGAASKRQRRA
jgi:SET domain-containing protein 6